MTFEETIQNIVGNRIVEMVLVYNADTMGITRYLKLNGKDTGISWNPEKLQDLYATDDRTDENALYQQIINYVAKLDSE